jgi:chromosome segregation and condensation protein ScpB
MDQKNQTKEIMEALIFVQNKPIKIKELAKLLDLKIKKVDSRFIYQSWN